MNYEVIESAVWRRSCGRAASIYGSLPWVTEAERAEWKLEKAGWTVRNPRTGEVGIGRKPCATREEAVALAAKLGPASALRIGD